MIIFYILVVLGILASSASQILLKKSAMRTWKHKWAVMLNWRVIVAYSIFFGSLVTNIWAMHHGVNLKDLPILESLGYVFVPLLSYITLKEPIGKRMFGTIVLIIIGIIIFYL